MGISGFRLPPPSLPTVVVPVLRGRPAPADEIDVADPEAGASASVTGRKGGRGRSVGSSLSSLRFLLIYLVFYFLLFSSICFIATVIGNISNLVIKHEKTWRVFIHAILL